MSVKKDPAIAPPLILIQHFTPGYLAGGPTQSVANMGVALAEINKLRVLCSNVDFLRHEPYPGLPTKEWVEVDGAETMYLPEAEYTPNAILELIRTTNPRVVYANGLFNPISRALALRHRFSPVAEKLIIAPRGELQPGAIESGRSPLKKAVILALRLSGFPKRVHWHVTSDIEAESLKQIFPVLLKDPSLVTVLPNLPFVAKEDIVSSQPKAPNALKAVFVSRIAVKKQLHILISALAHTHENVALDIIGGADDPNYLQNCTELVGRHHLEDRVRFLGSLPHREIQKRLPDYEAFVLPTMAENYGHAIVEALGAGVPVIITDTTPWSSVEQAGAGLTVEANEASLSAAITKLALLDDEAHRKMRLAARSYFQTKVVDSIDLAGYVAMFSPEVSVRSSAK